MGKGMALLLVLVLAMSSIVTFLPVKAGSRTIAVPDDYSTIASAIGNATHGDTIFVRKGIYEEHLLVINKTLTLIGEDKNLTIIKNIDNPPKWELGLHPFPPPKPDAIQISADNVKISGFTITSTSKGIYTTGKGTQIVGNVIKEFYNADDGIITRGIEANGEAAQIIANTVLGATFGISVGGSYQTIAQNTIEGGMHCIDSSGQYNSIVGNILLGASTGISFRGNSNVIYNNTVANQGQGIGFIGIGNIIAGNNITWNGGGIEFQSYVTTQCENYNNIILKNWITNNRDGINIYNGQNNTVYANYISDNQIGISVLWDQTGAAFEGGKIYFEPDRNLWQTAYSNTFYHNNFVGNGQGAADWSWQGTNAWDNGVEGNYWSDYAGTDANHDGIGDKSYTVNKPYTIYDSFGDGYSRLYYPKMVNTNEVFDRYPLMSPFDIDSVNVDLPEWASHSLDSSPEPQASEPFPTTLAVVATGTVAATVAGAGLIVYFKKTKKSST